MDGFAFDRLTRSLTLAGSRRRALGGLLAGTLGLLDSRTEDTAAKKKKPCPPCKKRKKGKCKKKLPDGTACGGGICQDGSCVATVDPPPAPPPPCVPEPQATTCAGAPCGTARNNNCGQPVACNCPRGQDCLLNGTCARPCTEAGSECFWCGGDDVGCSKPSTEGVAHCVAGTGCTVYQTCAGTAECPQGTHCQSCGTMFGNHCVPVSACTGNCAGADACQGTPGTCPGGGQCFQPVGGGPTRCGVPTTTGSCGCTSHQTCEANHGTGAFCVQDTGPACFGCAADTFCATTP